MSVHFRLLEMDHESAQFFLKPRHQAIHEVDSQDFIFYVIKNILSSIMSHNFALALTVFKILT